MLKRQNEKNQKGPKKTSFNKIDISRLNKNIYVKNKNEYLYLPPGSDKETETQTHGVNYLLHSGCSSAPLGRLIGNSSTEKNLGIGDFFTAAAAG